MTKPMPEAFDPYHRWLGIHPKDQPPHHYRLLGIDLFENDAEVIRDAAERQMAHVRKYQLGKHSAISQKILNELAAAKACLFDPVKKAKYDDSLKSTLNSPPLPSTPIRHERQVPPVSGKDVEKTFDTIDTPGLFRRIQGKPLYIASGVVLVLAIILLATFFMRGNRKAPATSSPNKEIARIDKSSRVKAPEIKENESASLPTSAKAQDKSHPEPPVPDRKTKGLSPLKEIEPQKKTEPAKSDSNLPPAENNTKSTKQQAIPSKASDAIIEGVGWKKFCIGATKEQLIKAFGKPDNDDKRLQWNNLHISCSIDNNQMAYVLCFNSGFENKTTAGIEIGSSLKEAMSAYGESDIKQFGADEKQITWPSKGILINFKNDKAVQIVLYATNKLIRPKKAEDRFALNLPSGKTFDSRIFDVDLKSVKDMLKDKFEKQFKDNNYVGNAVFQSSPNDQIQAWSEYDKGKIDGIYLACYKNDTPIIYANYIDGSRNGMLKKWNETGERIYWCQYAKNFRQGFCCYFKDDILRIVLELNRNKVTAVHLCSNSQLEKSFDSKEQAAADENVKVFIDELNEIETELMKTEVAYKKQVREEDQRVRQQKAAVLSVQGRDSIQDLMNQRGAQRQGQMDSLRRKGGGM
jgi:antitoxin component YwqK of YwqJK toxin-antitoxin module